LSIKDWGKFALLGLIWGSSFFWIKLGLRELPPLTLVALRILLAAVGLTLVAWAGRVPVDGLRRWADFLVIGILNAALPFFLITWSEQHIPSGVASILNSTVPLFTILLSPWFVPEDRWTAPRVVGMGVGFLGVIVLLSPQAFSGGLSGSLSGHIGMLLASICYAVSPIYARRRLSGLNPRVQALGQMWVAAALILPIAGQVEGPLALPRLPLSWLAVGWLGIVGSCAGNLLFYSLLNSVGPTRTALVSYLFPLVGVILGVGLLAEPLTWQLFAGGALIIGGVVLVNARRLWIWPPRKASGVHLLEES